MNVEQIIAAIEEGMKQKGLTCREVYISSGISRNTVRYWRDSKVGPNLSTLQRLLSAIGKKIEIVNA